MAGRGGPVGARAERYAALRAASRAVVRLSSSNAAAEPDDREFGQPGRGELEGRLREAEHQTETSHRASSTLLARIDAELDALAGEILAHLRGIPLSRLRATVPSLRSGDPEGATSLLDLCLESKAQGSEEQGVLDAAIALLRSQSSDGPSFESDSPASPREADGGSWLDDSEALAAIAHELLRRLAGTTPGDGGAAKIAAALDLAKLTAFEKGILRRPDADPLSPTLRSAVALRLIAHGVPELSPRLAALGLDPTKLRRARVPEVCVKLDRAVSTLSARADDDARWIADLRSSLLSAWGEKRDGQRPERVRRAARSPSEVPRRRRRASSRPASPRKLRIARAIAIAAILAILVVAAVLR